MEADYSLEHKSYGDLRMFPDHEQSLEDFANKFEVIEVVVVIWNGPSTHGIISRNRNCCQRGSCIFEIFERQSLEVGWIRKYVATFRDQGVVFPIFELQSKWIVLALSGKILLPS
ncbi:hypothetical protein Ccrd_016887 [Cynara cardunculus var. scolymus]|uniref:Uncharacterized protein n=1 Tax=Cynara cardunculus var. scolymus TaxID=59895 RepID=A0A124SFZ5_CYNCS|nr:hypothetical protein Ccrd_016887 [Cynara cardunculus var. scolymus]